MGDRRISWEPFVFTEVTAGRDHSKPTRCHQNCETSCIICVFKPSRHSAVITETCQEAQIIVTPVGWTACWSSGFSPWRPAEPTPRCPSSEAHPHHPLGLIIFNINYGDDVILLLCRNNQYYISESILLVLCDNPVVISNFHRVVSVGVNRLQLCWGAAAKHHCNTTNCACYVTRSYFCWCWRSVGVDCREREVSCWAGSPSSPLSWNLWPGVRES